MAAELRWLPVMSAGRQVGTLGYRPPEQLMARMDRLFLAQQQRNLTIIVIALALTSLLLAGGGLEMGQVIGQSAPKADVPGTTPFFLPWC